MTTYLITVVVDVPDPDRVLHRSTGPLEPPVTVLDYLVHDVHESARIAANRWGGEVLSSSVHLAPVQVPAPTGDEPL